jgi:predicted acylesterase/phospholipase RssA
MTLDAAYPYKNILIPVTRESGEETMLSLATTIPYRVSYDHSRFWSNISLATIIEASCSAPSFFDPVEIQGKTYSPEL